MDAVQQLPQQSAQRSSLKDITQRVITAVKHHNQQVNAAYLAYYGVPSSRRASNAAH
jgi:hypothetical protein